jgi:peptide/nickel transport system permease protein
MRAYIIKRILWAIPTLFMITFFSYIVMRQAPGDPVKAKYVGGDAEKQSTISEQGGLSESGKLFKERFYLDKPPHVGYYLWLKKIICEGDFGVSLTVSLGTPVLELIKQRLPITLKLNIWSIIVVYLIAIPSGIYSAIHRRSLIDRTLSTTYFFLFSLPSFWVGLILLMGVSIYLPEWPTSGLSAHNSNSLSYWEIVIETGKHYILPVLCMSYGGFASLSRFARGGLLEVFHQDYIRTARAKGCSELSVIFKHALKNAMIPLVVIFAGILPSMVGGTIIVENIFDIEGMGELSLTAISSRDYPVTMTLTTAATILTLIGILISDILLVFIDPRISFDSFNS